MAAREPSAHALSGKEWHSFSGSADGSGAELPYLAPMSRLPHSTGTKTMKEVRSFLFVAFCVVVLPHEAEAAPANDDGAIPQPVKIEDFDALVSNPPFTRSLGISDSLILTGLAHFDNDIVATLFDTKTMESSVVSKKANQQGWLLVGVEGNPAAIQTWRARIQVPGGEVVSIRYQKPPKPSPKATGSGPGSGGGSKLPSINDIQIKEAQLAAVNYKEGFSSDGYPKAPPPEIVAKLSRLSVSQREDINRIMFGYRNQGLGLDERRKIYEGLVERSIQGRR